MLITAGINKPVRAEINFPINTYITVGHTTGLYVLIDNEYKTLKYSRFFSEDISESLLFRGEETEHTIEMQTFIKMIEGFE